MLPPARTTVWVIVTWWFHPTFISAMVLPLWPLYLYFNHCTSILSMVPPFYSWYLHSNHGTSILTTFCLGTSILSMVPPFWPRTSILSWYLYFVMVPLKADRAMNLSINFCFQNYSNCCRILSWKTLSCCCSGSNLDIRIN